MWEGEGGRGRGGKAGPRRLFLFTSSPPTHTLPPPLHTQVNEGTIDVDQSALTGESLPVKLKKGFPAQMGSTVVRGEVNATVQHTGKDTFFGRTAMLLNQGESLGNLQKILLRIVMALSAISILLCIIVLIYLLVAVKEPIREAISFVVVLLVASIPIAIEIVSTTTLALGSRALSKQGAIVSKLTAIEEMAGMNMLCSDKTGTLTLNKMVIQEDCPTWMDGFDMKKTLQCAAMAAKWWETAARRPGHHDPGRRRPGGGQAVQTPRLFAV